MFSKTPRQHQRPVSRRPVAARPALEALEDRATPAGFFLTGVGSATDPPEPYARIYDATMPGASSNVIGVGNIDSQLGTAFSGSVRVACGDVNHDGMDDVIVAQGPGPGSGSRIRIYQGGSAMYGPTALPIADFYAYSNVAGAGSTPGFGGGVFVAAVDLNGDGYDELITSPGLGARGHIKVFNFHGPGGFLGSNPELRASFFAYTDFAGEIRVTTLTRDVGGVPTPFVVTASGAGTTQCDVRLYGNAYNVGQVADLTFVPPALQFFPFAGYAGGVSVAAGDANGDGNDDLFVAKNDGISNVHVFDVAMVIASGSATPASIREFEAFAGFMGEVRLGAADVDGDGRVEVLTSTGSSPGAAGSHIKAWNVLPATPVEVRSFFAYQGYVGGVWLSTNDMNWMCGVSSTDTPVNIPDNGALLPRSTITVAPPTLNDVTLRPKAIRVGVTLLPQTPADHHNADLDVALRAPDGTQLDLFNDVNDGGAGFFVTLADDPAFARIETAAVGAPLTGTFRPEGPASLIGTFGNLPAAGDWKLLVRDDAAGDLYRLTSWWLWFDF